MSRPRTAAISRSQAAAVLVAGVGLFLLALLSPVTETDSDPAMALVASQALLDHGTLDLGVYQDAPGFAYDFDAYDYRVRRRGGGVYHYSAGLAILSLPFVWLANRMGVHMLDQTHEFALQNVLSALVVAAIFVLLCLVGRHFANARVSSVIALVTVLGSTLVSTLSTALWNTGYQLVLVLAALLVVLRRRGRPLGPGHWAVLTLLVGAAFLCRPTTAFFGLAFLVYLLGERHRLAAVLAGLGLAGVPVLAVLGKLGFLTFIPRYYNPAKLWSTHEGPWEGFSGILLSPSRGLFVYSPFVIVVLVAVTWKISALRGDRVLRWVGLWMTLHLLAVSMKGVWWGGHCYGPRLLTELMPGFAVLACGAWSELAGRRRTALAVAFLFLALPAIAVHSYQGLFPSAPRRWNTFPNIDSRRELLWDWRHPQFLATDAALEERYLELRRPRLAVFPVGETVPFDDDRSAIFLDWYKPEASWRWTRGTSPTLIFRLAGVDFREAWILALHLGAHGRQEVTASLNGVNVGAVVVESSEPVYRLLVLPGELLRAGENRLDLEVPNATRPPGDERTLALALRSFRLLPLPEDVPLGGMRGDNTVYGVTWDEDMYFGEGWSAAEAGWRWSDGRRARVAYPLAAVDASARWVLELEAGALGTQQVEIAVGGTKIGTVELTGGAPRTVRLELDAALLRPFRTNQVELHLPDAHSPPGDGRRLGVALRRLDITNLLRDGVSSLPGRIPGTRPLTIETKP